MYKGSLTLQTKFCEANEISFNINVVNRCVYFSCISVSLRKCVESNICILL